MSDWRTDTVEKVRALVLGADPEMVEEAKWRKASNPDGVPTFSCAGLVCTAGDLQGQGEGHLRQGRVAGRRRPVSSTPASTPAPGGPIDLHEGDALDEAAFGALVRDAVALNRS